MNEKKNKNDLDKSEWMTTEEAADYMRILKTDGKPDPFTLRNMVHQGSVPFYKPFGRLLFCRDDLRKLIKKSKDRG